MLSGISVVICCFNGEARITTTLEHLVRQQNIALDNWEVIVVDNGSTDNTAEKAIRLWNNFEDSKPAFRVVSEPMPGLSAARKKGIEASYFDYVLFCDDDNWLDEHYLHIALDIMKNNPRIGALGGTGHPVFEGKEPPYFWVNQYHTLAVGIQSETEGDITEGRGVLYGAGMVINKSAFQLLMDTYRFRFQLSDRIGNNLLSSGDHELCMALRKIGYRIYYTKTLQFKHFIPAYRTTIPYYKKLFFGFGVSYAMLHVYRVNKSNLFKLANDYRYRYLRSLKKIFTIYIQLLLNGYLWNREKYKYLDQLHILYANIGIIKTLGKVRNSYQQQFFKNPIFHEET